MRHSERIDLPTSVGYALKEAAAALRSELDEVLRPMGMTVSQYSCLELLAQRPGLSNSELARAAFVSRQAMNVLLQTLEEDGSVVRPSSAAAGRSQPARLTARGRRQLARASAAVRAVEVRMLADLSAAEQAQALDLLGRMTRTLND